MLINQFVESRSQFKCGLVNRAFAAALRALLLLHEVELEASTLQSDINCSYETLGPSTSNEILDKALLSSKPSADDVETWLSKMYQWELTAQILEPLKATFLVNGRVLILHLSKKSKQPLEL
ncbi:hypothetical protein Tco_0425903 [Tanacetum coccineum]